MELNKSLLFNIKNMSCEFRTIFASDVKQEYVLGLREQTEYIANVPENVSVSKQKKYINDIIYCTDDTVCGLLINNELVATAGIQVSTSFLRSIAVPVDYVATIGIFVFNKSYRGMGLGKTLVWSATYLLHNFNQAEWFGAGMGVENIPSLKSFISCGYKKIYENEESIRVALNYSELIKPEFIKDEEIQSINSLYKG